MAGVKYFLIPNVENFSWMTVVSAMGQMFYSLSIAMGILITFGSYMKKDVSIEDSTRNVEVFDTAIAIMAGLMIIPAVFAFSGGDPETLQAGPALMFITIPKVFASMGFGTAAGILFFVLVLFAAITSSIALTESAVSTFEDELHWGRRKLFKPLHRYGIIFSAENGKRFSDRFTNHITVVMRNNHYSDVPQGAISSQEV